MLDLYYPETVRRIEKKLIDGGATETDLIFRAAKGVEAHLDKDLSYTIISGKGNNGADGLCIALSLIESDVSVKVYVVGDSLNAAEKDLFKQCAAKGIVEKFNENIPVGDVILDCVFGIGFHGAAEGEYLSAIRFINKNRKIGKKVFSIDVPSGLDASNGTACECVKADKTFIIGYLKTGEYLNAAKDAVGERVFIDIGFPFIPADARLIETADVRSVFKKRPCDSNKYDFGFVGILGGSESFSGAAKLANIAACACASGAGVTRLIVGDNIKNYVAPYLLESTLFTLPSNNEGLKFNADALEKAVDKLDVLAVGMGMGNGEETRKTVLFLLENFVGKLIIDADGLNAVKNDVSAFIGAKPKEIVITPHVREFSRLSGYSDGEIIAEPIKKAKEFAARYGVKVLLKGPSTVVTDGVNAYIVDRGDAGMATAGSGDVLSGTLAAICGFAEGVSAVFAAPFICGVAAEKARDKVSEISHNASDTVAFIKKAIYSVGRDLN